jgi:mannitol/fructose-specific phosphotransferase system IIA component (Ntr-type)
MSNTLTVNDLVSRTSVHCHLRAGSRKRLFQAVAQELVDPTREDGEEAIDEIYDALVERERLGSTALAMASRFLIAEPIAKPLPVRSIRWNSH